MRAGGLVRPLHGAILRPIVAATALATIIMGAAFGRETKRLPAAGKRWAGQLSKKLSPIEAYVPMRKHPQLFESLLRDEWLADTVRDLVAAARNGTRHLDLVEEAPGVYSFELFTPAFADAFLDEVDAYAESGLPVRRPNSMNNYGLIVLSRRGNFADESRRRRGRDVAISWSRSDAVAATWLFRGVAATPRPRRGYFVESRRRR